MAKFVFTHLGGPWDGQEEKRELTNGSTFVAIVQAMSTENGPVRLRHKYDAQFRANKNVLLYLGYDVVK